VPLRHVLPHAVLNSQPSFLLPYSLSLYIGRVTPGLLLCHDLVLRGLGEGSLGNLNCGVWLRSSLVGAYLNLGVIADAHGMPLEGACHAQAVKMRPRRLHLVVLVLERLNLSLFFILINFYSSI